jgi:hypothetical protein
MKDLREEFEADDQYCPQIRFLITLRNKRIVSEKVNAAT